MIKHNTAKSKELLAALQTDEDVLKPIPQKELFNRATKENTLMDMMADAAIRSSNKEFFTKLEETLDQVEAIVKQS